MKKFFKSFIAGLLNFIYPLNCQVCKKGLSPDAARHLCDECWNSICMITGPVCVRCGRPLYGNISLPVECWECMRRRFHFYRAYSAALYTGVLKDCIHFFKYGNKPYLSSTLTILLGKVLRQYPGLRDSDMFVPVPLHPVKLRERGFNQSALLCEELSRSLNRSIPVCRDILVKDEQRTPQSSLTKAERISGIRGTFSPAGEHHERIKGKKILLVDDVYTTGATVNECAKILRQLGAREINVLTVARAE